jgi:hypothetical protein
MNELPEQFKDLSPESIKMIQEAIDSKVKAKVELHVERALAEQDELYSSKLEKLLEALDKNHSEKLTKIVESIDADRFSKMKKVVSKYEKTLNEDAKKFKAKLVESVSVYLDTYINDAIPTKDIQEAMKNKKAIAVLEGLRKTLAIDSAVEKESIKEAVLDGQAQISEASKKLESILAENAQLQKNLQNTQTALLIEQKTATLTEGQKAYIKKVMTGKSVEFIKENFDYTVKLLDRKSAERLESLKEEALTDREDVDHVISENTENEGESHANNLSPYLAELGKY